MIGKRSRSVLIFLSNLLLILSIIIRLIYAQDLTRVTVESVEASPGEETKIKVSASAIPAPGIASVQGRLSFDPEVLEVKGVIFPETFNLAVENIQTNSVRFAATLTENENREPITEEGVLFELVVQAIGEVGDVSELVLSLEVLGDLQCNYLNYEITQGTFSIIEVAIEPPRANFTFSPKSPTIQDIVRFTDLSYDPDGRIVSWLWEFGDRSSSKVQTPSHQYSTEAAFIVTLTVTDNDGLSDSISKPITVSRPGFWVINFPNPAKDETTFRYRLPENAKSADLMIFDITGAPAFSHELEIMETEFVWDLSDNQGRPLPNGLYFYFIVATDGAGKVRKTDVQKLVIQR